MSFCNDDALKVFLPSDHYFFTEETPAGKAEAIAQADDLIHSITGETVPDDASEADPIYRNIAARLVVYYIIGQGKLSNKEIDHRHMLYEEALDLLNEIAAKAIYPGKEAAADLGIYSDDQKHTELP